MSAECESSKPPSAPRAERVYAALYADFAPRHPPAGWQRHGRYIRHAMYVTESSGCWFRWQLSDDGEAWRDWLAT